MSAWGREQAALIHALQRQRAAVRAASDAAQVGRSVPVELEDSTSDLLATVAEYEQALRLSRREGTPDA